MSSNQNIVVTPPRVYYDTPTPDTGSEDKDLHHDGKDRNTSASGDAYVPDLNDQYTSRVEAEKSIGVAKIEALCE
jgi:hypothetical protein